MAKTNMKPLRLGIIGLSEGNGHPYSWSAICNGYDPVALEGCGFPVISRYLEKQCPQNTIPEARVTHIWTQDHTLSSCIAKATFIEHVVDRYTDMIGAVDGVLLARDDPETHYEFAKPFLAAGLPIYIDKPLALSVHEGQRFFDQQHFPGQLFTCSALRYAKEFQLAEADRRSIGSLRHIHAIACKDWDKYAVHVIEPSLCLAGLKGAIERYQLWREADTVTISIAWSSGLQASISTVGRVSAPFSIRLIGECGWKDLIFSDAYFAFRSALCDFVQGILNRDVRIDPKHTLEVLGIIEMGRCK